MNDKRISATPSRGAVRKVGLVGLVFFCIGLNIGSATFSLKNVAASLTGNWIPLATTLMAVGVFVAIPIYTVLVRAMPTNAATYRYAALIRPRIGTFVAWLLLLGAVGGGLPLSAFVSGQFISQVTGGSPFVIGLICLVVVFIPNLFGIRSAVWVQTVSVILIVAALGLFIFRTVSAGGTWGVEGGGLSGVFVATGLSYLLMAGAIFIVDLGDEAKNPRRTLPRALWISMGSVFVLFLLIDVAILAAGSSSGQLGEGLLFQVAGPFLSRPEMGFFLIAGGLVATISTMNGLITFISRLVVRLAEEGAFPGFLKYRNRMGAPVSALGLMLVVTIAVTLLRLPVPALGASVNIAILVAVAIVMISGVRLRRFHPDLWSEGRGSIGYRTVLTCAVVGLAINSSAIVTLVIDQPIALVTVGVALLLALVLKPSARAKPEREVSARQSNLQS